METHTFPHLDSTIHLSLFHSVQNSASLRSRLISASSLPPGHPDQVAVDFAFVDAKVIASREQLINACIQAIICLRRGQAQAQAQAQGEEAQGGMRTKTVHSEVLWCLMPGNNITDSLRKIGISPTTTSLILVHIVPSTSTPTPTPTPTSTSTSTSTPTSTSTSTSTSPSSILDRMTSLVEGELDLTGLDGLDRATDWQQVRKIFKLNAEEMPLEGDRSSGTMMVGHGSETTGVEEIQRQRRKDLVQSITSIKNIAG